MEYDRPKTIEELKAFCAEKGMPLEQMRFYIGEDFPEPRAFGIFQDENGEFVVYKNKADGTRSVRYHGPDEAYAVNELYEKLKSETELRRQNSAAEGKRGGSGSNRLLFGLLAAYLVVNILFSFGPYIRRFIHRHKPRGYYQYQSETYYYDYDDWYVFDTLEDDWVYWEEPAEWTEVDADTYFVSENYSYTLRVDNFAQSEYYHKDKDFFDWGSGSDYDDWDSGDTDWDSDW